LETDTELLDFLTRHLRGVDAEPCPTTSSSEAAALLDREKFDGIFLSLDSPGRSGLDMVERVRWSQSNSKCPIILITGEQDPNRLKSFFRAGVNFLLAKPVTRGQLNILLNATRGLMLHERRRYQRVSCVVPVHCQWTVQSMPQNATGTSIDLSSSGMLLKLGLSPPPGAVMQTSFSLPGDAEPFKVAGRVTRLGSDQKVSLQFSGLTERQQGRLITFCSLVTAESAQH